MYVPMYTCMVHYILANMLCYMDSVTGVTYYFV